MPSSATRSENPKNVKSSKNNILIPFIGIFVMLGFFGVLNSQWISAQATSKFQLEFGNQLAETQLLGPLPAENSTPTIIIPKIKVQAPIVVDVTTQDEASVQKGLQKGILHYGKTANPGEDGNVVLFGHSSGQVWSPGNYKFAFTMLNALRINDKIYIDYNNVRYVYAVTETKVVPPTDFSVIQPTDFPQLTLITCTPVGTNKNRLVVHAKQVAPVQNIKPSGSNSIQPLMDSQLPQ